MTDKHAINCDMGEDCMCSPQRIQESPMTTPAEQVALILADLRDIDETPVRVLRRLESLRDELTAHPGDNDDKIRALAVEQWAKDGEIEFDDGALVSGCEDGAYVQAWVWVDLPGEDED